MKKIPDHILEAVNCGERNASDLFSEYGEMNVKAALEQLKKSDEELREIFFNTSDAEKIYNKVIEKKNHRKFSFYKIAPMAAAAALLIGFLPVMVNRKTPARETERIKGKEIGPELFIYRQTDHEPELLRDNDRAFNGELIQIAYNSKGKKYGLIFSVDGNKNITVHLSGDNEHLCTTEIQNKITLLNYSFELDDAPEYEFFVFVTADEVLDLTECINLISETGISKLNEGKVFPENTEFTTFSVRKE